MKYKYFLLNSLMVLMGFFLAACSAFDGRVYLKEGHIEKTGSMVYARHLPETLILKNGNLLICSGVIQNNLYTELKGKKLPCETYNVKTGKFSLTGTPIQGASKLKPMVLLPNGKVLATGYPTLFKGNKKNTQIYDPVTGEWSFSPPMLDSAQKRKDNHAAIALPNGKILITGGGYHPKGAPSVTLKSTEFYDYRKNSYESGPPTLEPHANHKMILLKDDRTLIIGANACEIYDYRTKKFKMVGSLQQPRFNFATVLLENGKILVVGGFAPGGASLSSIEMFDPKSERFSEIGKMSYSREHANAVLLPNGKVLIGGGFSGIRYNNVLEIFDPLKNTISVIGRTPDPHPVTLVMLKNGKVLMLRLSSKKRDFPAEVYVPNSNGSK